MLPFNWLVFMNAVSGLRRIKLKNTGLVYPVSSILEPWSQLFVELKRLRAWNSCTPYHN